MVKAGDTRICRWRACSQEFSAADPRQRHCNAEHAYRARIERRPNYNRGAKRGPRPKWERPAGIVVLLPLGSNPRSAATNPYAGEIPERRYFCRRYERCLAYAESQRWPGFACDKCYVNEPREPVGWNRPKGSNWEP